MLTTRNWNFAT